MEKAYTITPEKRQQNIDIMREARYRYGESLVNAPEKVKDKCREAAKENAKFQVPQNEFFTRSNDLYNLYLNRDTAEPITARELYDIVNNLLEEIGEAERRAKLDAANWD